MATVTPINVAEAIFEPFWDPALSGFPDWQIAPGAAHGLRIWQNWCWVSFEWNNRPASGPAVAMARALTLDLTGYDQLLVSIAAPVGAMVRLTATTEAGPRTLTAPPAPVRKRELALSLAGATRLERITLAPYSKWGQLL